MDNDILCAVKCTIAVCDNCNKYFMIQRYGAKKEQRKREKERERERQREKKKTSFKGVTVKKRYLQTAATIP